MSYQSLESMASQSDKFTALLYCAPGVGKSTAIGLIAEKLNGRTLVLDVDRTIIHTLMKGDVVKDTSKIDVRQIDTVNTWDDWDSAIDELIDLKNQGKFDYAAVAVDNLSELERCILSDLGSQGKNKGVPAQADYQYMQFKLVNSVRKLNSLGCNVILTAWETVEKFQNPDGTCYDRQYPKISPKIVDNLCGLCNVVGKIVVRRDDNARGVILEASQNVYAKNQIDTRKGCLIEQFIQDKE